MSMHVALWTVSRQHQWPDGDLVVEISAGGLDYCNPDAFCAKYPGELQEYTDPREAVETAMSIALAWQPETKAEVHIAVGATGGFTMPFEGESLTDETFARLAKWAEEQYEKLDKCAQCGDLLGTDRYGSHDMGEYDCCSEYCAEQYYTPVDDE